MLQTAWECLKQLSTKLKGDMSRWYIRGDAYKLRLRSWKKIGNTGMLLRSFHYQNMIKAGEVRRHQLKLKNRRTLTGKKGTSDFRWNYHLRWLKRKKKSWSSFMLGEDRSERRRRRNLGGGFMILRYGGDEPESFKGEMQWWVRDLWRRIGSIWDITVRNRRWEAP